MNRTELEAKVTDRLIAALERGTVPWQRPWAASGNVPTSVASGKPYRGINTLLLWAAQVDGGYDAPLWMTYKQAQALGGNVRKGEKGTTVVFWRIVERVEDGTAKKFPLLRTFTVFNVAQTEGVELPPRFAKLTVVGEPVPVLDGAKAALDAYVDGPTVTHVRQDRAFYRPSTDSVTLPQLDQFETPEGYASTLFHELVHSTGHASRLARDTEGACFGNETYAKEELVAEIGAAMLAAVVGVDVQVEQSAAYVASWLRALKDDRSLLISAAQQAQKAVDRIVPPVAVEVEADADVDVAA